MVGKPIDSEFVFARNRVRGGGGAIHFHCSFNQLNPFIDLILPIEFSSRFLDLVTLIPVSRRVVLVVAQRLHGEGFELSGLNLREDATALVGLAREMSDGSADHEPPRGGGLHDRQWARLTDGTRQNLVNRP